jgi:hypothetical protein
VAERHQQRRQSPPCGCRAGGRQASRRE